MNNLRDILEDYLSMREYFGFSIRIYRSNLQRFMDFMQDKRASHITAKLAVEWASGGEMAHPIAAINKMSMLRGFAKYLHAIDTRHEVPGAHLLPFTHRRKRQHIYTRQELSRLMAEAERLPSTNGMRGQTYATLLGLLWVSGMRISEALNLNREDVDLDNAVLFVHKAKLEKSRVLPIHSTTADALRKYAVRRDTAFPKAQTTAFFLTGYGKRPERAMAEITFAEISRKTGLRTITDRTGPRLHDFRHTFVVNALVSLYRKKVDVDWHLHPLAVYLGHIGPSSLYWYLSAIPELMELARKRLENKLGDLP